MQKAKPKLQPKKKAQKQQNKQKLEKVEAQPSKKDTKHVAVILGCSKCRYLPKGCAQCRNPRWGTVKGAKRSRTDEPKPKRPKHN